MCKRSPTIICISRPQHLIWTGTPPIRQIADLRGHSLIGYIPDMIF